MTMNKNNGVDVAQDADPVLVDPESNEPIDTNQATAAPAVFKLPSSQPRNSDETENSSRPRRFSKKQLGITAVILLTIAIILAIVIPLSLSPTKGSENDIEPPIDPPPIRDFYFCLGKPSTNNPSSAACTVSNNDELVEMSDSLFGYQVCPCQSDENCCTSEEKALAWMIRDTFNSTLVADMDVSEDNRKARMMERFVVVHLYFHARLDDPLGPFDISTEVDHCAQYSYFTNVGCDSDNRVLTVYLENSCKRYPAVTLPATIGELSRIQYLQLSYKMDGSIPSSIGRLTELKTLHIGFAGGVEFEGEGLTGAIPTEIGNLVSLRFLILPNQQLTGVPTEIGNLVSLEWLLLYHNQLTAKLPTEIGKLSSLQQLYLNDNQMTDPFPAEVNQLSNLNIVDLSGNPLSIVPPEIKTMSGLGWLKMNKCSLQGSLSDLADYPSSLVDLFLTQNQLTGTISSELNSRNTGLTIDIRGNLFTDMALTDVCKSTETDASGNPVRGADLPTFIAKCSICDNAPALPCCESCAD